MNRSLLCATIASLLVLFEKPFEQEAVLAA